MLLRKLNGDYSENHTKPVNTARGKCRVTDLKHTLHKFATGFGGGGGGRCNFGSHRTNADPVINEGQKQSWPIFSQLGMTQEVLESHDNSICLILINKICGEQFSNKNLDKIWGFHAECIKTSVLWDVALCRPVNTDRRFRGTYCFNREGYEWCLRQWAAPAVCQCLPGYTEASLKAAATV
jgi:hypothetical protein